MLLNFVVLLERKSVFKLKIMPWSLNGHLVWSGQSVCIEGKSWANQRF
jgi:hypothetical protein